MTDRLRRPRRWFRMLSAAVVALGFSSPSWAETQHIPMGLADFMAGVLPPPGVYWLNYLLYVQKDTLRDEDGDKLSVPTPAGNLRIEPDADVFVNAARFVWMSPYKLLGANYGAQVIFPLYTADVEIKVGGQKVDDTDSTGIGDIIFAPIILAWHFSPNFHAGFAVDIAAPTGPYKRDKLASQLLNKNHWTFEPLIAVSYWVPGGLDLSAKIMYDFHTKNDDFDVDPLTGRKLSLKPGQEFHFDWGVSYALGKEDFRLGLAGWYYQQITEDEVGGVKEPSDFKSRAAAIGPAFKWWPGMGKFSLTAKWLEEFAGENVVEGRSFWINTTYAF
jgi:hypothetical protein